MMNDDKWVYFNPPLGEEVRKEPGWGVGWISSIIRHSKVTRMRLVSEKPSSETMDAVAFAQERLGFEPDEEQARALRGGKRGIVLCSRQWGEIHCDGGEGCASSDFRSGQP